MTTIIVLRAALSINRKHPHIIKCAKPCLGPANTWITFEKRTPFFFQKEGNILRSWQKWRWSNTARSSNESSRLWLSCDLKDGRPAYISFSFHFSTSSQELIYQIEDVISVLEPLYNRPGSKQFFFTNYASWKTIATQASGPQFLMRRSSQWKRSWEFLKTVLSLLLARKGSFRQPKKSNGEPRFVHVFNLNFKSLQISDS